MLHRHGIRSITTASRSIKWSCPFKTPPRDFGNHPRWSSSNPEVKSTGNFAKRKPLTILAIESSADDSCCAIVNSEREILANVVITQHHLNVRYGGIHPLVAQGAHDVNVPRAISKALRESGISPSNIDAIAHTRGPGMRNCLATGAISARALAAVWDKPLIGIHHMQAHALTPLLTESTPPAFPFLVLLVSGGHTQLVLASALDKFEIVLDTIDNKLGDVFDKTARSLSLPTGSEPNGLVLEKYASLPSLPPFDKTKLQPLPKSINDRSKLVFSLAGLLSATERIIVSLRNSSPPESVAGSLYEEAMKREVSRIFQDGVVEHICRKIRDTIIYRQLLDKMDDGNQLGGSKLGGLVVSGGVASNQHLRKKLREMLDNLQSNLSQETTELGIDIDSESKSKSDRIPLYFPPIALCTDNAAMIAWTAILRVQSDPTILQRRGSEGEGWDLDIRPNWSLESLYDDVG